MLSKHILRMFCIIRANVSPEINNNEPRKALISLTFCILLSLCGSKWVFQGEQVFFIVTNYIETPNQRLSFCAEVS